MSKLEKPQFTHDCEGCTYLGRYFSKAGGWGNVDLYVCTIDHSQPTVIARFGNEAQDYGSGLVFADSGTHYTEAAVRAVKLGLLDPNKKYRNRYTVGELIQRGQAADADGTSL
jgi:hypothetical protein